MKKGGILLGGISVLAAAFGGVGLLGFRKLGTWLAVSDPEPKKLDVIFTFGGGGDYRIGYSRELAERHPKAIWIVSTSHKKQRLQTLAAKGVDTNRITVVEACRSTREESAWLRTWLAAYGKGVRHSPRARSKATRLIRPANVALVSSRYHMRRIKNLARKTFRGLRARPCLLPVPFERDYWPEENYRYWWRDKAFRSIVLDEAWKAVLARFWR